MKERKLKKEDWTNLRTKSTMGRQVVKNGAELHQKSTTQKRHIQQCPATWRETSEWPSWEGRDLQQLLCRNVYPGWCWWPASWGHEWTQLRGWNHRHIHLNRWSKENTKKPKAQYCHRIRWGFQLCFVLHPRLHLNQTSKHIQPLSEEGIHAVMLETCKCVPIHKKGSLNDVKNFRPISLLSCTSKVLEKIVHNRVMTHLEDQGLIPDQQYDFRKNNSTTFQLFDVAHQLSQALDERLTTKMLFLDVIKALDRVWHKALLSKLQNMGIRGSALKWFSSYLTGRHQRVVLRGVESRWRKLLFGVPQGSILGPLLYILFTHHGDWEVICWRFTADGLRGDWRGMCNEDATWHHAYLKMGQGPQDHSERLQNEDPDCKLHQLRDIPAIHGRIIHWRGVISSPPSYNNNNNNNNNSLFVIYNQINIVFFRYRSWQKLPINLKNNESDANVIITNCE